MNKKDSFTKAPATTLSPRLKRELKTVRSMIAIYCSAHHQRNSSLCPDCEKLLKYAETRVMNCPFSDDKPTCGNCSVHCYKPSMKKEIVKVMRYSGPRILFRHPLLAFFHLIDGKRSPVFSKSDT